MKLALAHVLLAGGLVFPRIPYMILGISDPCCTNEMLVKHQGMQLDCNFTYEKAHVLAAMQLARVVQ